MPNAAYPLVPLVPLVPLPGLVTITADTRCRGSGFLDWNMHSQTFEYKNFIKS